MGYSHYWSYTSIATSEQRNKIINEIIILADKLNYKLKLSKKNAIITIDKIFFNHIDNDKDCNESIYIEFNKITPFRFCKTNREEKYDLMVCLVLLSLANNISTFRFSSDGTIDDWLLPITTYKLYIGKLNIELERLHIKEDDIYSITNNKQD